MATITSIAGGTLPSITGLTTTRYALDTVLTENAASYSWLSDNGHKVVMLGSFTYPGGPGTDPDGSVTQVLFDFDNNGSNDLTVDFAVAVAIPSIQAPSDFDATLLNFLFQQADTMTLAGITESVPIGGDDPAFVADSTTLPGDVTESDDITITGAGRFSADLYGGITNGFVYAGDTVQINSTVGDVTVLGDQILLGSFGGASMATERTLTYGDDTITDTSAASAFTHRFIGDLEQTTSGSEFFIQNFGDDTIVGGANGFYAVGDAEYIIGNDLTLNAGADSITGSSQGDTIIGDIDEVDDAFGANSALTGGAETINGGEGDDLIIGDVTTLDGANTLTGGDDSLKGGADNDTVVGDVESLGANAILIGGDDSLEGGAGDDVIYGDFATADALATVSAGDDSLTGGSGNDTIYGQGGNDELRGGPDNDVLSGGQGNDSIDGGLGTDVIDFSESLAGISLTLNGSTFATAIGQGTDMLRNIENVIGSDLNDTLTGDAEDNVFEGGAGNDILDGGTGTGDVASYENAGSAVTVNLNDIAQQNTGGAGLDTLMQLEYLLGSEFNDQLFGDAADNVIDGGEGNDVILVREASETFTASGTDTLLGGSGNDTIGYSTGGLYAGSYSVGSEMDGGTGLNTFAFAGSVTSHTVSLEAGAFRVAGSATDVATLDNFHNVTGGLGNDEIRGDALDNMLLGGSGDDTLIGGAGFDTLDGEVGSDTASYVSSDAAVMINMETSSFSGGHAEGDVFVDIANVTGSVFGDTLTGSSSMNVLDGDAADDHLSGGGDNDTLIGGEGQDTLIGGAGADSLDGGDDVDLVDYSGSALGVIANLFTSTGLQGDAEGDNFVDIENILGTAQADTLTGTGAGNDIDGGDGADFLRGLAGEDMLDGAVGADDLSGGAGNDTLSGGTEADTIRGQGEDDELHGDSGNDDLFGGAGADMVFGGAGDDDILGQGQDDTIAGEAGDDTLSGGSGSDSITGGDNNDLIFGNGNNDTLLGESGNDTLQGAAGLDELYGGSGADSLLGGTGADLLDGGAGNDTMSGGVSDGARDTFVFAVGYELDRINQFDQVSNDRLQLDDALWLADLGVLSEQDVIDTFGSLNTAGNILTLDFGGGDVLEVQNSGGIDETTLGTDVLIF